MTAGATRVELAYDAALASDRDRQRDATLALQGALRSNQILFGGEPLPTSIKPHFIRRSDNDAWTGMLRDLLTVLQTTADEVRLDPHFRTNGPFSPEAWELLDIDPGYSRTTVVCRPDVVWDSTSIGLLEVNADSPAMMLYADAIQDLQRDLYPMTDIVREGRLTFDRRIPVLLDALLATYREWGGTSSHPTIAVVDFPGQKTSSEQEQLARQFTALGCPSFVCTPADLEVRGGRLYGRGEAIDIIQRRLLFPEIVKRRDELGAFLTAYRERLACVINPLRSYLVGCKAILAEQCARAQAGRLSAWELAAVMRVLPCTVRPDVLSEQDLALSDRARWVLKPAFGSGGSGVVIGRYTDDAAWNRCLERARQGGWIAQSYLPIPLYGVPLATAPEKEPSLLYANWNPFFFGGVAAGGIARVSADPVVGISVRGALLPTVIVNDE
jgi:hypothetical protein